MEFSNKTIAVVYTVVLVLAVMSGVRAYKSLRVDNIEYKNTDVNSKEKIDSENKELNKLVISIQKEIKILYSPLDNKEYLESIDNISKHFTESAFASFKNSINFEEEQTKLAFKRYEVQFEQVKVGSKENQPESVNKLIYVVNVRDGNKINRITIEFRLNQNNLISSFDIW